MLLSVVLGTNVWVFFLFCFVKFSVLECVEYIFYFWMFIGTSVLQET